MPRFGGHSMWGPLRMVLVCSPAEAGWANRSEAARWRELGYRHAPDFSTAQAQHETLCAKLRAEGAEILSLPPAEGLTLDAIYAHDASFVTDAGVIGLRMGKRARDGEPGHHIAFLRSQGVPVIGRIDAPGTVESGDLVWLDRSTLLAGRGYRTNAEGLRQLDAMLAPLGISVIEAPLPHAEGPEECLHLMSLLSVVGPREVLVDPPWLAVSTLETLVELGFERIEIEPAERGTMACNVLCLAEGVLLAIEENVRTNARLRDRGYRVETFPGAELSLNGGGGPTCLTRPLLRGEG